MDRRFRLIGLCVSTLFASAAVGASYAYADLSLNRQGVSATVIGLNTAMPALGWLLFTPLLPKIVRHFSCTAIAVTLLLAAICALPGFVLTTDPWAWMPFRFVFGGACGLMFRVLEYWISAAAAEDRRARSMGIYSVVFCAGAAIGVGLVPEIGLDGWPPVFFMMLATAGAALSLIVLPTNPPPPIEDDTVPADEIPSPFAFLSSVIWLPPVVLLFVCGGLIYGLLESVPYGLLPVYVVRAGAGENMAAWSASAYLLGQVLLLIPLSWLADRTGKLRVAVICCAVASGLAATIPFLVLNGPLFLATMTLWGGTAGILYALSLSLIADHCRGAVLVRANAGFGTLYALGSLVAPPSHGVVMDLFPYAGLAVSSAAVLLVYLLALLPRLMQPAEAA